MIDINTQELIQKTLWLQEYAEALTIFVCMAGMIVTYLHWRYFKNSKKETSKRLRIVFASDFFVYAVTFIMGVGLFYDLKLLVHYDIIVRPAFLLLNVIAAWRLYAHFKEL